MPGIGGAIYSLHSKKSRPKLTAFMRNSVHDFDSEEFGVTKRTTLNL